MRYVRAEQAVLNKLIRELLAGSAAGFVTLALMIALTTMFQVGTITMYLKLAGRSGGGVLSNQIVSSPVANGLRDAKIQESSISPASTATLVAMIQPVPVASNGPSSAVVVPDTPGVDSPEQGADYDKKQVNNGINKAGDYNSSSNANPHSYDKKK